MKTSENKRFVFVHGDGTKDGAPGYIARSKRERGRDKNGEETDYLGCASTNELHFVYELGNWQME